MDVVSAKACLFGADDVVDDIGQEDAAYREELIGKGRQTADIGRRLRPDRTYICLIREYVWLFPRDCAAWKQLETGPPGLKRRSISAVCLPFPISSSRYAASS